jgi:hypothetical protein
LYLDLSRSPGWPWTNWHRTKKETLCDPKFERFWSVFWASQFTDDPIVSFTQDFLKSELRTLSKMEVDDVRSIAGVSFELVLAGNRFDLKFNKSFVEKRDLLPVMVGYSTSGGGWSNGIYKLAPYLDNVYEFDVDRHEQTFRKWEHDFVQSLRENFSHVSEPELKAWRNVARQKCTGPIVDGLGYVRWLFGTQKSGQWSTLIDNTLITWIRMVAAFIDMFKDFEGREPTDAEIHDGFRLLIVGDDCNFSTKHLWFKPLNLKFWFWQNLRLSTSFPTDQPRNVHDVSFLSAKTVMMNGVPIPSLDTDKCLASIFLGNENVELSSTLLRLCNIRTMTWPNAEVRSFLDLLIGKIREQNPLVGDTSVLLSAYKTDKQLCEFWTAQAA